MTVVTSDGILLFITQKQKFHNRFIIKNGRKLVFITSDHSVYTQLSIYGCAM